MASRIFFIHSLVAFLCIFFSSVNDQCVKQPVDDHNRSLSGKTPFIAYSGKRQIRFFEDCHDSIDKLYAVQLRFKSRRYYNFSFEEQGRERRKVESPTSQRSRERYRSGHPVGGRKKPDCDRHDLRGIEDSVGWRQKISLYIAMISGYVVLIAIIIFLLFKRKISSVIKSIFCWKQRRNTHNIKVFLKNYQSPGPKRCKYSEVKQMTNNFRDKLGQGGFGSVFKGKLTDDRLVAVKVLSKSKGNGEDFINEVTTIGTTNHVNIVKLLGFCSEGSRRALIYDFMPNGSLDKYIYTNKSKEENKMTMEKLFQISLGAARGLQYLHTGCSTPILHLDIKPHNILLDQDWCPKIADFGLAKLCAKKESSSSSSFDGARGTTGYIAPELCYGNQRVVSCKSDVYSYGMMMLEMVGGRKNLNPEVEDTSQIYFPQWIYKHLKQREDMELVNLELVDESEVARKMIVVGMWCIQTDPSLRPSMSKVVEMLEGRIDNLQFPPNPFLDRFDVTTLSSSLS